ncbi:MAG TPA: hypothetical protein VLG71_02040 [Candidatus Limnocylindria bacterium]|nr:hypothetical protein [Candidatus Limnocylindria bacterium]
MIDMKTTMQVLLFGVLCSMLYIPYSYSNNTSPFSDGVLSGKLRDMQSRKRNKAPKNIVINYNNEELIDIINYIAAKKGINILLPMGPNTINTKVSLQLPDPITLDEAWQILNTLLDTAGYSLTERGQMYAVIKNSKTIGKEPVHLFINTDPKDLPDSDERIRVLYYLSNIKVEDESKQANTDLYKILQQFLPPETASFQLESKTNAVIITERASIIKSIMKTILSLDQTTFQEKLEIIPLRYTSADFIGKLFADNILKSPTGVRKGRSGESVYFSDSVKITAEPRTNTLIIIGKEQAVSRIKDFITSYLDVPLESGKSILHTYQLLYLDAGSFEQVLTNIVRADKGGGTGQSSAGGGKFGAERYFEEVIIKADQPKGSRDIFGSNTLIIAAKNDDWVHIKKLIEQLDKPQPTVIIEVLIADLNIDDLRQLASQFRNPAGIDLPTGMDVQSGQLGPVVLNDAIPANATTVASDLLGNVIPTAGGGTTNLANIWNVSSPKIPGMGGTPGATMLSYSDSGTGSTWGLTQLLRTFNATKILSHPHIIATNNKEAQVKVGQLRLVPGQTSATAAAPTLKVESITADLTVRITPRISAGNTVQLYVNISIDEFITSSLADNTRATRRIETRANVQNSDILALGGLIQVVNSDQTRETPILGRVPILGWLFKNRLGEVTTSNLTVFISPTIVQPRLRHGIDTYTKDYVQLANRYASESQLFEGLRDPVTRFFFRTTDPAANSIKAFIDKDELKYDTNIITPTAEEDARHARRNRKPHIHATQEKPKKTAQLTSLKNIPASALNQVPTTAETVLQQQDTTPGHVTEKAQDPAAFAVPQDITTHLAPGQLPPASLQEQLKTPVEKQVSSKKKPLQNINDKQEALKQLLADIENPLMA